MSVKSDRLIEEPTIEAAKHHLREFGHVGAVKHFAGMEPELYYAVCQIANSALSEADGATSEMQDEVFRAIWAAALLAIEAYRIAHYRLWAQSHLGSLLEQLDPELARRAAGEGT